MGNKVKLTFELLEQEMEIFSQEELRGFLGGTDSFSWQQLVDAYNNGNLGQIAEGSYIMGSSGNMIYGGQWGGELNNVNVYINSANGSVYYQGTSYSLLDPNAPFYKTNYTHSGGGGGYPSTPVVLGVGIPGYPFTFNDYVNGGGGNIPTTIGAFQLGWDTKTLLTEIALGGRTLTGQEAQYMRYLGATGILANAAASGVTVYDAIENGLKTHHVADLFFQVAIYDIALAVPVAGWLIGGAYFVGDMYFKNTHNGVGITEYYLD